MDAVDLFCGVGGLSLGLQEAGINVKAALDNWDAAVDVYNRNVGPHAQTLDLSDPANAIDLITPLQPDLIAGGPPCQDFSSAGDRSSAIAPASPLRSPPW